MKKVLFGMVMIALAVSITSSGTSTAENLPPYPTVSAWNEM